ncbi:MAG: helix-turn-helix domain-containing protein [Clostridia bacterium]|jgi:transcriptional regulator with XRE-family HTH domain|nr:helix-turn-helix domain-containing protein [Clostridia bacterium]
MTFGERLTFLREEKGKKRKELAEEMNLSYSTISKYESDERFPDKEMLIKLADYFSCSVDYLIARTDIRRCFKELKGEYLVVAKELEESKINPKDIKAFLELAKNMKKR